MSTDTIDTKALIAATPATVALVRRELDKSRESQRGECSIPKAVKVDCAMVERLCRIAEKQADRLAALEAESSRLLAGIQLYKADFEHGLNGLKHEYAKLEQDNARLRGLLGAARCPNCDGSGAIPHGPTPDGDWEAEQCQWCYEKQEALAGEGGDAMSIASGYGPNWTTAESRGLDAQRRIAELEQQLAAAQAEAREWRERSAHVDRGATRLAVEKDTLAQELARVREIVSGMREYADSCDHPSEASKRNAVEYWLAQLEDALSQAAERESRPLTFTQGVLCSLSILDGYGDSIAYREVANPHDPNQLWEEADEFDREHLARHGYRPTPAAQESGDA